ncbi:MAG: alpha/beta fold hydrolase [Beijerinckiaceae bacterium]
MRLARTHDGDIGYLEAGQGDAIVLLHGIGSGARSWLAQIADLSSRWRVIAWNAPGYPPSASLPIAAPSAGDYAERLRDLLDWIGVDRCHLVGHSLGCLIAARYARLYPSRVASLTLASCALGHARLANDDRESLLASRIGDISELGARGMAEKRGPRLLGHGAAPELISAVVDTMALVDPAGYAQAARMLSSGDLVADIEQLSPDLAVQFLYGDADVITPPHANRLAAQARPASPVAVMKGAGHACYLEQPALFSRIVEGFSSAHG